MVANLIPTEAIIKFHKAWSENQQVGIVQVADTASKK